MSSLYKCPSKVVVNLTNIIRFYDSTDMNKPVTVFEPTSGPMFVESGHLTEDILAKHDVIAKMEGMVKSVMNTGYGKFATPVDFKPYTGNPAVDKHLNTNLGFGKFTSKPSKGKHARAAKRAKS